MRSEPMPASNGRSSWRQIVAPYERPELKRSLWQVANTFLPFFGLWYLMYQSLSISYLLTLALALPAAGFLVRIFIIFHDCTHGAFFRSRTANAVLGTIAGVLTFTPYSPWRHSHTVHHATAGNLDKRGDGDVWTLTVQEYLALPLWQRIGYRIYRNPIIMFVFGPSALFLFCYWSTPKGSGWKMRGSVYLTNLLLAATIAALSLTIGWKALVLVHLPIWLIGGAAGVWLFYVQHQFEGTYYETGPNWDFVKAALQGSSFYKLPAVLQWFSGNIGFHHIHHLSPRIPNYNLERCHRENPMFQEVEPVTLLGSLKALSFRMWDEERKKLVGYGYIREYLTRQQPTAAD